MIDCLSVYLSISLSLSLSLSLYVSLSLKLLYPCVLAAASQAYSLLLAFAVFLRSFLA